MALYWKARLISTVIHRYTRHNNFPAGYIMTTDHIKMLCDISELNSLFEESSIDNCLQKTVDMVAEHMNADVCSIYIYDENSGDLVLKATRGLDPQSINQVTMKPGEGLVGTALKELRIIREDRGNSNPHFKFYPGTNEELYEAFLAVPIVRGRFRIGVLVIQRKRGNSFAEQDVMAMKATASQLATLLEHIKLLLSTQQVPSTGPGITDQGSYRFLKGKSASKGVALAPAVVKKDIKHDILFRRKTFEETFTLEQFETALKNTEIQLEDMQRRVEEKLADAASLIFASHLLMLKDQGFVGAMRDMIRIGENPPSAIVAIFLKYKGLFSESPNLLIREKVQDIEDLTKRIMNNLLQHIPDEAIYRDRVIIARDLFPSELLMLSIEGITGVILVSGGVTSHVGILARSLKVPLVFIDEPDLLGLPENITVLLDAEQGNLYINPTEEIVTRFREQEKTRAALNERQAMIKGPALTKDGSQVRVMLNINLLSDMQQVSIEDIDGVGLYRTEFPFMIRNSFPSEEEQYVIYKKLVDQMNGKPVTFRTLDIGGDKVLSYYDVPREENPFLGMRSIRFSLQHEDLFKQQIRAILRAGTGSSLKIMFPMISSLDEFLQSRTILDVCLEELRREGAEHNAEPLVGMMVEIPSVVPIIEDLAGEADFFSIGTNDLIQYTIAVDRTNEKVAAMYIPHHPAILRSLEKIARAGIAAGIEVSICGDMANQERYIPFLLGIGITYLSVDAMYIPRVKKTLLEIDVKEARERARKMLAGRTITEIETLLDTAAEETQLPG